MERIIETLRDMRRKAEISFIENSITVYTSVIEGPLPDTKSDLKMIMDLNKAISTLEYANMAKVSQTNN